MGKKRDTELEWIKKRNEQLRLWVIEQGDISLEEIMVKSYKEFIRFEDFGRVLHYFMQYQEIK
jgi:hypothetical protein